MGLTNIDGIPFYWDDNENKKLFGNLFPDELLPPSFSTGLQGIPNTKLPQFPSPIEWSNNNLSDLLNYYYYNAPTKEIRNNLNIYYYKPLVVASQNTNLRIGGTQNSALDEFVKLYDKILSAYKPDNNVNKKESVLYQDNNSNKKYDEGDIKFLDITILTSYDGAALLKQWKSFNHVADNQLVLFLELNYLDIYSDAVLLARGGKDVMKYLQDANKVKGYLKDKLQFSISEEQLKKLFESTQTSDHKDILSFIGDLAKDAIDYVGDILDDLKDDIKAPFWEYIGKEIDKKLRISTEIWNSTDPQNTIHKLVGNLTKFKNELTNIRNNGVRFKGKVRNTEIIITLKVLPQKVKDILFSFIEFIQDIINFIKEANVGFAFCCGFWNGLVDLLVGICYLLSILYDAAKGYAEYISDKKYYDALLNEYKDNFIQSVLFMNWFKVAQHAYEKLKELKKELSKLNFTEEEIAYYFGYSISMFVEVTFLPLQIAKVAKLKKLEDVIVRVQKGINKIAAPIERVAENILGVFLRLIDNFLQLIEKGADEVIKFIDDFVEQIQKALSKALEKEMDFDKKIMDFLSKWDSKKVSGEGALGSARLSRGEIQKWKAFLLANFGTKLEVVGRYSKMYKSLELGGKEAAYEAATNTIYVRSDRATNFLLTHEMFHAEECFLIGEKEYLKGAKGLGGSPESDLIRTYKREKYVFDKIIQNQKTFTEAEIKYSEEYLDIIIKNCEKEGIDVTKIY